jgi:Membrane protein TerC, possibly involved in tellurium resistance
MVFVMPDLSTAVFWAALWKIIIANIILSGDNAVVIAMACHNLSDKYRGRRSSSAAPAPSCCASSSAP